MKLIIKPIIFFLAISFYSIHATAQTYIKTKEGRVIMKRSGLINTCLKSLHKDETDATAMEICECEVNKLDGHFTYKQYKRYEKNNIIDLNALFKEDSAFEKQINACYTNSGKTALLQAEGFENDFINSCVQNIQKNSEKKLDTNRVVNFCSCELDLVRTKKVSDAELVTLSNPNSIFFYEVMSKCGNPFSSEQKGKGNWDACIGMDINGPEIDTISVLNMDGMTYIKAKTGSMVQVWLFDTGSTDLLISKDMELELKNENILNEKGYIGIGEYEMANGAIDTCRKYRIDNVQIGKFRVNNVIVAVTDKGRKIIIGRSLLNKFSNWILDNKKSVLILSK